MSIYEQWRANGADYTEGLKLFNEHVRGFFKLKQLLAKSPKPAKLETMLKRLLNKGTVKPTAQKLPAKDIEVVHVNVKIDGRPKQKEPEYEYPDAIAESRIMQAPTETLPEHLKVHRIKTVEMMDRRSMLHRSLAALDDVLARQNATGEIVQLTEDIATAWQYEEDALAEPAPEAKPQKKKKGPFEHLELLTSDQLQLHLKNKVNPRISRTKANLAKKAQKPAVTAQRKAALKAAEAEKAATLELIEARNASASAE